MLLHISLRKCYTQGQPINMTKVASLMRLKNKIRKNTKPISYTISNFFLEIISVLHSLLRYFLTCSLVFENYHRNFKLINQSFLRYCRQTKTGIDAFSYLALRQQYPSPHICCKLNIRDCFLLFLTSAEGSYPDGSYTNPAGLF